MQPLTNSQLCADRFREIWNPKLKSKEGSFIIYMNHKRQQVFHAELCTGTYKNCQFDIREAIQYALTIHSDYIIIGHNHTGGSPEPSQQDIEFTMSLKEWLVPLHIVLVDHIILTGNDYYSFADNNMLDRQKSA
jgi:DNA repair protein RadC